MPTRVPDSNVLSFASMVDDNTVEQARQTASMPFIAGHLALMPDAHFGRGAAVGTVIPTTGAVIPAAVGVDIGCGMIAARTRFAVADVARTNPLNSLRDSIVSSIPMSKGGYNTDTRRFSFTRDRVEKLERLAAEQGVDLSHSPKWTRQLGTLGGGNHFIELCARLPPEDTDEFRGYIRELNWAQQFALQQLLNVKGE